MRTSKLKFFLVGGFATAACAAPAAPVLDVYKSPSCGCCGQWVDNMKANGFSVRAHQGNQATTEGEP